MLCTVNLLACDRFEANHQPSVKDALGTTSRRNIAYTLAVKEQLCVAHRLLIKELLSSILDVGPECQSDIRPLFFPDEFNSD